MASTRMQNIQVNMAKVCVQGVVERLLSREQSPPTTGPITLGNDDNQLRIWGPWHVTTNGTGTWGSGYFRVPRGKLPQGHACWCMPKPQHMH